MSGRIRSPTWGSSSAAISHGVFAAERGSGARRVAAQVWESEPAPQQRRSVLPARRICRRLFRRRIAGGFRLGAAGLDAVGRGAVGLGAVVLGARRRLRVPRSRPRRGRRGRRARPTRTARQARADQTARPATFPTARPACRRPAARSPTARFRCQAFLHPWTGRTAASWPQARPAAQWAVAVAQAVPTRLRAWAGR